MRHVATHGPKTKAPSISFDEVPQVAPSDPSEFLDFLKKKNPVFVRCLAAFVNGDVKMSDGSQHPLLQSIADQVLNKNKVPTPKQMAAFRGVFNSLVETLKHDGVLEPESEESRELMAKSASTLLAIGVKWIGEFTPKTRDVITSMDSQFKKKGRLSVKQLKFLQWIVEQLPPGKISS